MYKIKLKLTGNIRKTYELLIKSNINIYDIELYKDKIIIIIDYNDYDKIKTITKNITILKRYSLLGIKYNLNKYKLLIIFIIISILINIILSNIIFDVVVINSNKVLVTNVYKELNKRGLKKYRFVLSRKKEEYLEKELLKNDYIEIINIKRIGTKYIVEVEEKKVAKDSPTCTPRDIISKKNGTITKIEVEKGEIQKEVGDYISKDELIVSGSIHNKEDIKNKICSKGKVYASTWYKVKIHLPRYKTYYKTSKKNKYKININNKNKVNNIISKYNIIDSNILPINISIIKYKKKEKIKKKLSIKELEKEAKTITSNKLKHKGKIVDKKILKKGLNNSTIDIDIFVVVEEDITKYRKIEEESD